MSDSPTSDYPYEFVAIEELRPHPRNYNSHPDDQLDHIIQSIREHGIYRNIIVAKDNTILAGHGVVQAAAKMGRLQLPVIRLPLDPHDPRALKVLAGDNEISHLSEKDDRLLSEILKEIKDHDAKGLVGTGYDEMMLANLLMVSRPASEISNFDAAAEWVGMPEYESGEDPVQVVVSFRSPGDKEEFLNLIGAQHVTSKGKTTSLWWPDKPRADRSSVRFEG